MINLKYGHSFLYQLSLRRTELAIIEVLDNVDTIFSWWISTCVPPAQRLTGLGVGVGDVRPNDLEEMTPTELNYRRCGPLTEHVGGGKNVTLLCPPGGVTGRYLIVQTLGRRDILTLCEVEAGMEISLTHWGQDKMADILQTKSSKLFPILQLFKFYSNFFHGFLTRVRFTLSQQWFWGFLGTKHVTCITLAEVSFSLSCCNQTCSRGRLKNMY